MTEDKQAEFTAGSMLEAMKNGEML
jgi:hypothetical protein